MVRVAGCVGNGFNEGLNLTPFYFLFLNNRLFIQRLFKNGPQRHYAKLQHSCERSSGIRTKTADIFTCGSRQSAKRHQHSMGTRPTRFHRPRKKHFDGRGRRRRRHDCRHGHVASANETQ